MAINADRPIITYENIALFQSDTPAHSAESNSGQNLSFLPLVQGVNFSVDIARTNVGALGTKDFIDQSNRNAPDMQFSINTIEDFEHLFSGLMSGESIRDNLNVDRNFYAVIGDKRGFDVSGENLSGRDILSFGNCFLNNVSISQSINGTINSTYDYIGSNLQAQELQETGSFFSGNSPSIDLTGNQSQNVKALFIAMGNYHSSETKKIIPYDSTNVTISGSSSVGNFLIKSDLIQNFDLNLPINRKTIYSLGKKYPVNRKALFPSEGSLNFSNRVSNFEVSGDKANLKDFLNSDESYVLNISGQNISGTGFNFQINEAKLSSQSYDSSIGSDVVANLGFGFELNKLIKVQAVQAGSFLDDLTISDFSFQLSDVSSNTVQARDAPSNFALIDAADGSASDFAMLRVKCTALQAGQSLQITDLDYSISSNTPSGPNNVQMKIPTDDTRTNNPGVFDVIDKGTVTVNDNSSFFELGVFNCTRGGSEGSYQILISAMTFGGTDGGSSVDPVTISIPRYTVPADVNTADYTVPAAGGIPLINFIVNNLPEDD